MAIPLVDLNLQYLVQHIFDTIRANPEERINEIFGDARVQPLSALFGDDMIRNVRKFFTKTKIPVVLGFNLDPAQIPGVTIHLERSSPAQAYMGDKGGVVHKKLRSDERLVNVKAFSPSFVDATESGYLTITPPAEVDSIKILPGLHWRDAKGYEFGIGQNGNLPTMVQLPNGAPVSASDTSRLEVISPFDDVRIRQGAMQFDEVGLITVHGQADRTEGLWVWAAVQHGLLKYRPLLEGVFGLQLAAPMSSDFAKDDSFSGSNVWRRFITVNAKAMWTWDTPPMLDVAAFLTTVHACNKNMANQGSQSPGLILPTCTDTGGILASNKDFVQPVVPLT
jgi:hypothetical protein